MERNPLILIVDDNPAGQKALESLLLGQGYDLEFASNGEQALAFSAEFKPDVVLLDVMMPGLDGFEVCRRLRANPLTAEVPVVMVTALDDSDSKLASFQAGADDFVSKPFDRTELQTRVRTITRLNRYHALLEEREKLQQLSRQILEVQERERRAVAVELHDEIGQGLTGLKHLIEQARDSACEPVGSEKLTSALMVIADLIGKVRSLSLNLRPSMLDDFGLYPALTWLAEQFSKNMALQIHCNFSALDEGRFPPEIETAVFRITQEALTNITRHAHAQHTWIMVETEPDDLIFMIQDDGSGFDLAALAAAKNLFSTGLSGMQERVRLAGGTFKIDSTTGSGTKIVARFPIQGEKL